MASGKKGLKRYEEAMAADPRQAPIGVLWRDESEISMNPGFISWYPDVVTMIRVLGGAARGLYGLTAEEAQDFEEAMDAFAASLGRASVLTPEQVDDVNELGEGIGFIDWHGTWTELVRGTSSFAEELREGFRDANGDESQTDDDDDDAGPSKQREISPARPILPDEEDAFLEFLAEWGN